MLERRQGGFHICLKALQGGKFGRPNSKAAHEHLGQLERRCGKVWLSTRGDVAPQHVFHRAINHVAHQSNRHIRTQLTALLCRLQRLRAGSRVALQLRDLAGELRVDNSTLAPHKRAEPRPIANEMVQMTPDHEMHPSAHSDYSWKVALQIAGDDVVPPPQNFEEELLLTSEVRKDSGLGHTRFLSDRRSPPARNRCERRLSLQQQARPRRSARAEAARL